VRLCVLCVLFFSALSALLGVLRVPLLQHMRGWLALGTKWNLGGYMT
jgi:hypothetical protein